MHYLLNRDDRMNILIVGAGLAGATIARILAENSLKVIIIEKRKHIAGNVFDFINKNNERIHKYGPHLLHCRNNSAGLKFLSRSETRGAKRGTNLPMAYQENSYLKIHVDRFRSERIRP